MHVVIIGNGITGVTAATTLRKLSPEVQITIVSSESQHFYSRTALMYLYMGHMQYRHIKPYEDWFWIENKINLIQNQVTTVNFKTKYIYLADGQNLTYDKLLLATGSKPKFPEVSELNLTGVQGFYNLKDLQQMEINTANIKRAVIVGGGLIGIELAEMLFTRKIPVTFLVRDNRYWGTVLPPEESQIIQKHILEHSIDLRLGTSLKEIIGDENGKVKGILTSAGDFIPCEFVGISIGVTPNIDFLTETELAINRGILVSEKLETNIPDVFAAGDCAELQFANRTPIIEQLWYTGRMQGEVAGYNLLNQEKPYKRGIWFNSAKFFNIEYQTYGYISPELLEHEQTVFWQHPKLNKSIRINYERGSGVVLGFNLLGIRYRQEVCEKWIKNKMPIDYVLKHLKEANFDPEFYRRHESALLARFNQQLHVEKTAL